MWNSARPHPWEGGENGFRKKIQKFSNQEIVPIRFPRLTGQHHWGAAALRSVYNIGYIKNTLFSTIYIYISNTNVYYNLFINYTSVVLCMKIHRRLCSSSCDVSMASTWFLSAQYRTVTWNLHVGHALDLVFRSCSWRRVVPSQVLPGSPSGSVPGTVQPQDLHFNLGSCRICRS